MNDKRSGQEGHVVAVHPTLNEVDDGLSTGLDYLHAYRNSRPNIDKNTCGQAAIATILDHHGIDPFGLERSTYDEHDAKYYWDDGRVIDSIKSKFPPDVVFGLGTSGGRLIDAFKTYGLKAQCGFSGIGSIGWGDQWTTLQRWVAAKHPVPVILDTGAIGGSAGAAHWAVVYKVDDSCVHIGNWARMPVVDQQTFLHAWHCQFLPYGFNHCGVYAQR